MKTSPGRRTHGTSLAPHRTRRVAEGLRGAAVCLVTHDMVHEQKFLRATVGLGSEITVQPQTPWVFLPEGLPKGQAKCPGAEPAGKPVRDAG